MRLKTVFIRFYKSFNYDYLRKFETKAKPHPWDLVKGAFYPFVRIPLDRNITTIVGANESGKSHLLSAIEKAISGKGIEPADFCRHSQFFTVTKGEIRTPDFGLEWTEFTEAERSAIKKACPTAPSHFETLFMFRISGEALHIYFDREKGSPYPVDESTFCALLPQTLKIDSKVALPATIAIRDVLPASTTKHYLDRQERFEVFDSVEGLRNHSAAFQDQKTFTTSAPQLFSPLQRIFNVFAPKPSQPSQDRLAERKAQVALARDLILKVARVDEKALTQLENAIREGREGHANGIIQDINTSLARYLNFPRIWAQDRQFSLRVSPREFDLVFTIQDRTGTEYSFDERSNGLRFFLSYYIQYLAHVSSGPETEILLMDEPDAYLSSQAQQDLLKVFDGYANPEGMRRPVQVVYVTHSPFLIDRNHSERIRVLEKGNGDEGTRVVKDAARNHYEPLRSAFGAFVAETTFIGNCNLMVEGAADQVLLAGAATHLRAKGSAESETLDLNRLTIVPAGSASHVPYLVYLARGRDTERPAVIVFLDSDSEGDRARRDLKRGGPRGKQILSDAFIAQVRDIVAPHVFTATQNPAVELEDLVPLRLCVSAINSYLSEFESFEHGLIPLTESVLQSHIVSGESIWDAIARALKSHREDLHIDKTGFARCVIRCISNKNDSEVTYVADAGAIDQFERNMKALFRHLKDRQRLAEKELTGDRVSQKISRLKHRFLTDHKESASREEAREFLRDVEDALDDSIESDEARNVIRFLIREFSLEDQIVEPIPEFDRFQIELSHLEYAGRLATQQDALVTGASPGGDLNPTVQRAPQEPAPVAAASAPAIS